jgi:hypothetical protein
MVNFKADIKDAGIKEVKGKFTKLKGYSKLKFFSHKENGYWYIREYSTGKRVGKGTTEIGAKQNARAYLKEYLHNQIEEQIEAIDSINEV